MFKHVNCMLLAFCAVLGLMAEEKRECRIQQGFAEVKMHVIIMERMDSPTDTPVDRSSITAELYSYPMLGHEESVTVRFETDSTNLNTDSPGLHFCARVPVQRTEEMGNFAIFINGRLMWYEMIHLSQMEPQQLTVWMWGNGRVFNADINGIYGMYNSYYKIPPIAKDLHTECSINSDSRIYTGQWEKDMKLICDSSWVHYRDLCLKDAELPADLEHALLNNLKKYFASRCVMAYVNNSAYWAELNIPQPPIEAYAFLDSIDYSPDVFLRSTDHFPLRQFLAAILLYLSGDLEYIGDRPIKDWQESMTTLLKPAIKAPNSLLLDLLAATSYVRQIDFKQPLNERQKQNIHAALPEELANILFERNRAKEEKENLKKQHTLTVVGATVFDLVNYIDSVYPKRPVMVDMWNTWCIPCLDAMKRTEEIKTAFADSDVVFLYISDTSSPHDEWERKAKDEGGDHVRISTDAAGLIFKDHNLTGFPSYLFFDRNHRLVHAQTSFPGVARFEQLLRQIAE